MEKVLVPVGIPLGLVVVFLLACGCTAQAHCQLAVAQLTVPGFPSILSTQRPCPRNLGLLHDLVPCRTAKLIAYPSLGVFLNLFFFYSVRYLFRPRFDKEMDPGPSGAYPIGFERLGWT